MNIDQDKISQEYQARVKRIDDAIALKIPDRVPVIAATEFFCPHYSNDTIEDTLRDYEICEKSYDKYFDHYKPDLGFDPIFMYPINVFETLGLQWMRWPGNGVRKNGPYQYIEGEYMTQDEYDELIFDPTKFMLTKWIPRSFKNLKGLEVFNGLDNSCWLGFFNGFVPAAMPETQAALKTLMKGGEELGAWYGFLGKYEMKMKEKYGIPNGWGGFAFAPFDMIGDSMRGTIGSLTDIIEVPDKVLEACDKLTKIAIDSAIKSSKATGNKFIWMWLHKGIEEFMSVETFRKIYWPSLLNVIKGIADAGLVPVVYGEGKLNNRLEIFRELPVGKCIMHFEQQDMKRAKEVLSDITCISGNVPVNMLTFGTPDDVREYVKKLMDDCKGNGGFILDTDCVIDDVKPECLDAYFEAARTYGNY